MLIAHASIKSSWVPCQVSRRLKVVRCCTFCIQELQVQEGTTSFLADEYKQMLSVKQPGSRNATADDVSTDQQQIGRAAGAGSSPDGKLEELDAAVEAFKQLFRDYSRFSTGGVGAVKQQLSGLEKLLRGNGPGCNLEDAVAYMQAVGK